MTESKDKLRILVTGSQGFVGWHLCVLLGSQDQFELVECNREQFNDDEFLTKNLPTVDVVVHLAGMNRGDEKEIAAANPGMASRLVGFLKQSGTRPKIIYSSSTHADGDSVYGQSKREAGEIIQRWGIEAKSDVSILILPHIFGEFGKPFYNSVVSTFCHQLAVGDKPEIQIDGQLHLLHAQEVAQLIVDVIQENRTGEQRPRGVPIRVSKLLERLDGLAERYRDGVVPNFQDPFDLRLFNTWRSYLPPEKWVTDLTLHEDNRGCLFEAIRADGQGQVFLSTTFPGITRGNHYHFQKVERFLVVSGEGRIRLRKMLTDEIIQIDVCGESPQAVDIPTFYTHNITNTGETPMLTLFWAHEHFDPTASDTFYVPVEMKQGVQA